MDGEPRAGEDQNEQQGDGDAFVTEVQWVDM
jgi:hypothetical protein